MKFQAGDILLVKNSSKAVSVGQGLTQFFKILTIGPLLLSLGRNGGKHGVGIDNAGYGHALIYISNGLNWAHATNSGLVRGTFETKKGDILFRKSGDLAGKAAEVAKKWTAVEGKYNVRKGILSAFGSSSYGSGAKERAGIYRANRDESGGPQNKDDDGKKSWFCSMFVIACWQAACNEEDTASLMALYARNSTPMTLASYLFNHPEWTSFKEEE